MAKMVQGNATFLNGVSKGIVYRIDQGRIDVLPGKKPLTEAPKVGRAVLY